MSEIDAGSVSVFVVPDLRKFKPEVDAKTKNLRATIGVDADTSEASAQIDEASRDRRTNIKVDVDRSGIDRAAGSISGLTASILALGPALVPITGALVGAGGAFGASALAGGAGAGALGASLIGNIKNVLGAQKDLAKAKKDAATASQTQVTANRAVVSAEQSLSLAQGQGKIAQQSLTQAREAARNELRGLSDQLKGAALAEGDASIAVRRARESLRQTLGNKSATQLDRDEARQALADAVFQLDQVKKRRSDIASNAKKERAAGVEGNAQVISARQGVASATASIASAQTQVTTARENAKKATKALTVAQQGLADTQKVLSGSAATGFVKSLGRAKDAWKDYLKVTAGTSFKVASKGLGIFTDAMPNVSDLSNIAAGAVSGLLDDLKKFGKSDTAKGFLDFFKTFEGPAITQFGHIAGNLALGIGGLLRAFAPVGLSLGGALEGLSGKFADFGTNAGSNKGFQGFLAYVRDVGPKVAATFGHLVQAAGKIAGYLAPLGGIVLGAVDAIAKFIIKADPGTIDTIALSIGGLALAFGKGPLGLAFALGAVLSHKQGFVTFLKKAGDLAGGLVTAFGKLPDGIKAAAIAAVGVGVIGSKLKGLGLLGGKGLGGGGGILGLISKAKPIPVFVVNEGFGGGKGLGGDKAPGLLSKLLTNPLSLLFGPGIAGIIGTTAAHKANVGKGKAFPTEQDFSLGPASANAGSAGGGQTGSPFKPGDFNDGKAKALAEQVKRAAFYSGQARQNIDKLPGTIERGKSGAQALASEMLGVSRSAGHTKSAVVDLLAELEKARQATVKIDQGVSAARTSKVDRQLGGVTVVHNGNIITDSPRDYVKNAQKVSRHKAGGGRMR